MDHPRNNKILECLDEETLRHVAASGRRFGDGSASHKTAAAAEKATDDLYHLMFGEAMRDRPPIGYAVR